MSKHAFLSPPGSHHWLNGTPSAMNESEFLDGCSSVAEEGIAAHAFCQHKLKKAIRRRSRRPVSDYDSDGDTERDDAYKGHYLINANSTTSSQIVDKYVKPILDRKEVYSGCYAVYL